MTKLDKTTLPLLRAAIGLAAVHFPLHTANGSSVVSSRDIAFLLDGHVDVWSAWSTLESPDTDRIVQLLQARRAEYADSEWIRRSLSAALEDHALPGCSLDSDQPEELRIACTPGMPLREFVDEALATVTRDHRKNSRCLPTAAPGSYYTTVRRRAAGQISPFVEQHFTIRDYGAAATQSAPPLVTSAAQQEIKVPVGELRDLAAKLDAAKGTDGFHAQQVDRLFKGLQSRDGLVGLDGLLDLTAGETALLNAPTGVGKSVGLVETLACWMVQQGLVLTVLVPSNAEVLKLARAVESHLEVLGLAGTVAPLMSPTSSFERLDGVLRSRPSWDPDGLWTLGKLGYGCALAASAESEAAVDHWQPGHEPCVRLTVEEGDRQRVYACPWRMTCGKFGPARAALTASVIVTSHVNFHRGRLHLPIQDDGTTTDRTTIEELVLRRSHLIVIDEIDTFQRTVIDQAARGLLLEERGRLGTPLHTLENEFVLATGKINPGVESSVRGMVHHTKFLASTYVAALDQGLIGQTRSKHGNTRYWLVPRRWDGVQTATLWGLADHEPLTDELTAGFRSLFPGEGPPDDNEPSEFADVRAALAQVTDVGAGPNRLDRSRVELETALEQRIPDEADRAHFIDRALQRTLLERIRGHLRQFVYDAPHLAGVGVPIASEIAETFGPYSRWRVHPNGPLGRLLFAFRQQVDPSGRQPAKLSAAAFGGDPHTYTTTIGDITSLCRAGVRRPVLGLSATAYFPMAPHHHVHAEPRWWVSDIGISDVSIHPVRVIDSQRQPIKVSGRSGQDRDRALRDLAAGLWTSRLSNELARLANEDKDRRRILLATTSYQGARVVAQGLVRGGADPGRICLAIRPTASFVGDTTAPTASDLIEPIAQRPAGAWRELRADQLEEFPGLGDDVDILIAPLARVERGLNIIGADNKSALGSIWLLVRPMPVVDEPTELLAHVNAHPLAADANDRLLAPSRPSRPADILNERVQLAGRHFEDIVSSLPYFRAMPMPVQLSIAAATMNGLIQLVGRARRGGTPARVHLADAAMLDSNGGPTFASLISRLRTHWESTGQLSLMQELYGTTLDAFFTFADDEAAKHELPEGDAEC